MSAVVSPTTVDALVIDEEKKFALFPKLPLELRTMIWKQALPGPRVIAITNSTVHPQTFAETLKPQPDRPKSNAVLPTLLHVNSESREITLKIYKLAFEHQLLKPIYIDSCHDTLFFDDCEILKAVSFPNEDNAFMSDAASGLASPGCLLLFNNVETIAIATDDRSSKVQISSERYNKVFCDTWSKNTSLGRPAEAALTISCMKRDDMVEAALRGASGF
ncbi:hypothetical protein IFR05_009701 [Cadophora sp. M221]|nr:hypothetical protein IFR05_009701 [Cadophora sp. M221]